MAASAATGSRDYCVINANYRAVPCHRNTLSVGVNRRVLCIPGLPHSWHRKSDVTRKKKRRKRRRRRRSEQRSSVETERERRCCGLAYTRERDIMALLQSAYITRARARLLSASSREESLWGLRSRSLSSLRVIFPLLVLLTSSFLFAPNDVGICTGVLCPRCFSRKLTPGCMTVPRSH